MIVLDSSAVVAIVHAEPDQDLLADIISAADVVLMSSVTVQECGMVVFSRRGQIGLHELWRFLREARCTVVPYDETQARAAIDAFTRYGKGQSSKARLNLGDCAAYALAKTRDAPLLFKGDDFTHTDLRSAL
jgi:ribonuclease VapC